MGVRRMQAALLLGRTLITAELPLKRMRVAEIDGPILRENWVTVELTKRYCETRALTLWSYPVDCSTIVLS